MDASPLPFWGKRSSCAQQGCCATDSHLYLYSLDIRQRRFVMRHVKTLAFYHFEKPITLLVLLLTNSLNRIGADSKFPRFEVEVVQKLSKCKDLEIEIA